MKQKKEKPHQHCWLCGWVGTEQNVKLNGITLVCKECDARETIYLQYKTQIERLTAICK